MHCIIFELVIIDVTSKIINCHFILWRMTTNLILRNLLVTIGLNRLGENANASMSIRLIWCCGNYIFSMPLIYICLPTQLFRFGLFQASYAPRWSSKTQRTTNPSHASAVCLFLSHWVYFYLLISRIRYYWHVLFSFLGTIFNFSTLKD